MPAALRMAVLILAATGEPWPEAPLPPGAGPEVELSIRPAQGVLQTGHEAALQSGHSPVGSGSAEPGTPKADRRAGLPGAPEPEPVRSQAAPAGPGPPIPLAPPGPHGGAGDGASSPKGSGSIGAAIPSLLTVATSLAVVLGLFLVVAWLMRRASPGLAPPLPGEVFEVLGRAPLAGRQQIVLVRLGSKLVLLCVWAAGVEALSEITDPDEATRLAGLCHGSRPTSASAVFRQIFQQFAREPGPAGLLEPLAAKPHPAAKGVSRGTARGSEGADV